jgi:hypothetical protein
MNIVALIKKGRVEPILKSDRNGVTMLLGWRRKGQSRKGGEWMLKKAQAWVDRRKIAAGTALSPGCQIVMDERRRQIVRHQWTPEHDDEHTAGELAEAAECYLTEAKIRVMRRVPSDAQGGSMEIPAGWPWRPQSWRPGDRIRELAKAGALFLAEADRLRRKEDADGARSMEEKARTCASIIDDHYQVGPLSPGEELLDIEKFNHVPVLPAETT